MEIRNRKINDFEVVKKIEAGIILVGREVKAISTKECDLTGSYILLRNGKVILIGSYIKEEIDNFSIKYAAGRDRELLLNKSEIRFLQGELQRGLKIIPVRLYKNKKYKIEIAVCRPLKKYDKREKEKEKQVKRETHE